MLRFYISIKNDLIIGVVVKKLLWSQNRAHFVEFGVNRLYVASPLFCSAPRIFHPSPASCKLTTDDRALQLPISLSTSMGEKHRNSKDSASQARVRKKRKYHDRAGLNFFGRMQRSMFFVISV
jgi:hypothetical protein